MVGIAKEKGAVILFKSRWVAHQLYDLLPRIPDTDFVEALVSGVRNKATTGHIEKRDEEDGPSKPKDRFMASVMDASFLSDCFHCPPVQNLCSVIEEQP